MTTYGLLRLLASGALFCAFAAVTVSAQTSPKAAWTILFYMDSDNNLEAPQMNDLDELMTVGSSAGVNLVVLVDRSAKGESDEERGYTSRDVGGIRNWTTAKMLKIEKGRLVELADWGEVNMGDPANLARFVDAALTRFPAERYGIVFGDHGAGWVGIGSDESAGSDGLKSTELPAGLKGITKFAPRFELIGFDACLMSNLEAAKAVAPFGRTMTASEELEPGDGWNYAPLLRSLNATPSMDGAALGRRVVETFRDFYLGRERKDESITLAVIDLDKIPALEAAANELGARGRALVKSGVTGFQKAARARSKADEFGKSGDPNDSFHFFDIADFAGQLKLRSLDPETVKTADAAIAAVKSAVIFKASGDEHKRSGGISIYLPPKDEFSNGEYATTQFAKTGGWLGFLAEFLNASTTDKTPPQVAPVTVSDSAVAPSDVVSVNSSVKADDIDEATFVLAKMVGDSAVIIGAVPTEPDEKGFLHEDWDGTWFTISDGDKKLLCPISDYEEDEDSDDAFYVEVPVEVRYKGSKRWREVSMYFHVSFVDGKVGGEFVNAYIYEGGRAREFEFEEGDAIRPIYLGVDAEGREKQIAAPDASDVLIVTAENDIAVGLEDVPAGDYLIGFTVDDLSGNTTDEFTAVEVE